jgi:hypothetical protein
MSVAVYNFNGVLNGLSNKIREKQDLANDWQGADTVVVWQDAIGVLAEMSRQAKKEGKKVIVAEHGLLSINDYIPPLSKPLIGDVFMAWGQVTKDWLVNKVHIPEAKIEITGSTIFSSLGERVPHEGKRVLFAPRHWQEDISENIEVANILKTYDKAYIYSKIIVGEHDPFTYPNPIMSERTVNNHLSLCYEALKTADVVVGIGEGTFAALAYQMNIPYISVDYWKPKELLGKIYTKEDFDSQLSYACRKVKPEKLIEAIDFELAHPEDMGDLRKKFVNEYLDGGDGKLALEKQLKVIYG